MFSSSLKFCIATILTATSLSACSINGNSGSASDAHFFNFGDNGKKEANQALVAYSQGNFAEAEEHVLDSLHENKKNAQALIIGALSAEQTNRPNRARQYYEDIILYNGNEVSVLGTNSSEPQKITETARKRLRQLNLNQNKLIIEDDAGNKNFNLSNSSSTQGSVTAMEEALFLRQQKLGNQNAAETEANRNAVEVLFNDEEKNTISRFIILKALAENDLITKEEFLRARQANIGGLLPLTSAPASMQVVKPVPTASIIIDRINALKSAVEDRAITPKEFSAERNLIIEAILPPTPSARLKKKIPSRDIISAAKDLRKLEVIYDLNLITTSEKEKEKSAIEQYLGLNSSPKPQKTENNTKPTTQTVKKTSIPEAVIVEETQTEITEEEKNPSNIAIPANKATSEPQPLLPDVTSPFN